jgi:hypothetical protein
METKVFYVEKTSGTSADTLLAVGLASLLGHIYRDIHGTDDGIFINDAGARYEITLPLPIDTHNLPRLRDMPVLLPLDSEKQREKQIRKGKGGQLDGFNYDSEMDKSRSYRERLKNLPPYLQTADARLRRAPELEEVIPDEGDTRLGHYQAISQMKIAGSFNELVQRWRELTEEQMQLHLEMLFKLFSNPDNDVTGTETVWEGLAKKQKVPGKAHVTALQIANPTAGKGANRAKASELAIGNQDSFWLLELLKFVGFMDAAAPLIIRESKDRKTYVIQPKNIELNKLQYIMREFRAILWPSSAIKLDIIASLRLAQLFVKHYQSLYRSHKRRRSMTSIAHGFEVTFYKDLGSAYATMNIASINLPIWLPDMNSLENVKAAEALLKEHLEIIQHIRNSKVKGEEGPEEYELLRFYRDFLSGRDLKPFWKFATAYSSYLISQREHEKNTKRWIRQLSYNGLETLIMHAPTNHEDLTEIIQNKGFQHIADAIRRSTVFAQYRRSQFDDRTYEVRYGLGQKLMRKARYNEEFLVALSDFLFEYEEETSREDEKAARDIANKSGHFRPLNVQDRTTRNLRYSTSENDLKEIVTLVHKFGSELVGSLLVAFGYAFRGTSNTTSDAITQESDSNIAEVR